MLRGVLLLALAARRADAVSLPPEAELAPAPLAEAPVHERFTKILGGVRRNFANVQAALEEDAAARGTREAARDALVPDFLTELSAGLATLRGVRADVDDSHALAPEMKAQVLWNVDRMLSDAERLKGVSLAPMARSALAKALSLRLGVLLTPAFWSTPISASVMAPPQQQHEQQPQQSEQQQSAGDQGGGVDL